MKYVLFYDPAEDVASKAPALFAEHSAHVAEFHSAGTLLMIGIFANVQQEGAMAIFTSEDAAQSFANGDPFVKGGVVKGWHVRAWNEVLHR